MEPERVGRVAVLVRGDRERRDDPAPVTERLRPIFDALAAVGLDAEPAVYDESFAEEVYRQLLAVDGVLVWVDPLSEGKDRTDLDDLLRQVADAGVWVSAHPEVILKIGTKEVLYRTKELGWGTDTDLYESFATFARRFPVTLASAGPRVLKQYRGNGGLGVWKVELLDTCGPEGATPEARVRVQNGRLREEVIEELPLGEFVARCEEYFGSDAAPRCVVDQAFQPRILEGAIRCYLSRDEVVGFSRQYAQGRSPTDDPSHAPSPEQVMGLPSHKTMYGPDEPRFAALRAHVETWVPEALGLLGVRIDELPAIWDADFLLGPKTAAGEDTYVLCEINVSAVLPFPEAALPRLATSVLDSVRATAPGRPPRTAQAPADGNGQS